MTPVEKNDVEVSQLLELEGVDPEKYLLKIHDLLAQGIEPGMVAVMLAGGWELVDDE